MGSPTSGTAQGEVTPHCTRAPLEQKSSKATIQGTDPKSRGNSCSWQGTEEEPILGGKDGVSPQPPSTSSAPGAKADVVPTLCSPLPGTMALRFHKHIRGKVRAFRWNKKAAWCEHGESWKQTPQQQR